MWPLQLSGSDNVPQAGAAILCPNHLSFFDSVFMMMTFDRPVYFIGKADYLDSWKTRRLFPALGMIPIDRDNGIRAMVALDAAADVLRHGSLLCVFPEGSRSRDGLLHRGHSGAARLAMTVHCPIVPVGITGTDRIQPPGARLPRPRRPCSMSIGTPVEPSSDHAGRKMAARTMTDHVMRSIAGLSGQRYVASYTSRTARLPATTVTAIAAIG
jgi:1-acyl-sn-glycerol-3-phosphate acyltransferase